MSSAAESAELRNEQAFRAALLIIFVLFGGAQTSRLFGQFGCWKKPSRSQVAPKLQLQSQEEEEEEEEDEKS